MRKTFSYLLATSLCLSSCIATERISSPKKEIEPAPVENYTYLDNFFFDPYPSVGSINYSNTERLIGSGVLISSNLVLTATHVTEKKRRLNVC